MEGLALPVGRAPGSLCERTSSIVLKASSAPGLEWFFSASLGRLSESVSRFLTRAVTDEDVSHVPEIYPVLSVGRFLQVRISSLQGCKVRLGRALKAHHICVRALAPLGGVGFGYQRPHDSGSNPSLLVTQF